MARNLELNEERKNEILDAALEVFSELGLQGASSMMWSSAPAQQKNALLVLQEQGQADRRPDEALLYAGAGKDKGPERKGIRARTAVALQPGSRGRGQADALVNPARESDFFMPMAGYNLTANTDLSAGGQISASSPQSEFNRLPGLFKLELTVHF